MHPRVVQRYRLGEELASGGMGSVHIGLLLGGGGFKKTVAIKVMHPHLAKDPEFRAMFLDEARTVSGIRHVNVVSTLDVLEEDGALFLVLDYVDGPPLSAALRAARTASTTIPLPIAAAIACDLLEGLHAAHEAKSPTGEPLEIVHRDISPHNVLIGSDGVARVVDFGVAIAADRVHTTRAGEIKGKLSHMPPEQARGERVDRRADVFAAGVVLFELLTGRLPHQGTNAADSVFRLMHEIAPAASSIVPELSPALDDLVACALSKRAEDRFATARAMAEALRATVSRADAHDVADWLSRHLPSEEKRRAERLSRLYAADAAADARATAVPPESKGKSQSPTRIERIDSPVATAPIQSLAVAVAPPIGPKPASLRMPLAVGGVFALLGMLGGAILLRVTPSAGETAHSATPISVSAPPAKDEPIAPQVSASPVASAPAEPSVRRPALHGQLPPSSAAAPPSSAISAPATSAKAPPCCILAGGRWERYSLSPTCVNNCPANVGP